MYTNALRHAPVTLVLAIMVRQVKPDTLKDKTDETDLDRLVYVQRSTCLVHCCHHECSYKYTRVLRIQMAKNILSGAAL